MLTLLVHLAAVVSPAAALFSCKDIDVAPLYYDLSRMDFTYKLSEIVSTPPTTTNLTWYINPCGAIDEEVNCPKNSQVCGVETVVTDDETVVTQVIPISSDSSSNKRRAFIQRTGGTDDLVLEYYGFKWGDRDVSAQIKYQCTDSSFDKFEWVEDVLTATIGSPEACPKASPSPGKGGKDKNGEDGSPKPSGGSWLWSFFLFLMLIFGFYVAGTAYANYRRFGSASVELGPLAEILRDLPYLARDFIQKIMASFGSSRGGYSAV